MLTLSTFLVCFLTVLQEFPSARAGLLAIRDIASFGDDIADVFNGEAPFEALLIGDEEYKLDKLLDKVDDISNQLTDLTETVNAKMDKVLTVLLSRLPLQGQLDTAMNKFHDLIIRIDGLYAQFKKYSKRLKKFNKRTIDKFIKSVTSYDTGDLPSILNRMHRLFAPSRSGFFQKGLLQTLTELQSTADPIESCNLDYSFQQRLYKIYKTIVTSEIRGFVMTVFAYMILTVKHNEPYTAELESTVAQLVSRSQDYITLLQLEMKRASREIKFCGNEHLNKDQWAEFTGLASWLVVNEQQVFPDGTCYYECSDVWAPKIYRSYKINDAYLSEYTPRIDCVGRINNCGWIGETTFCDQPNDSPKRYTWVDTENGRYGPDGSCPEERETYLSWYYFGFYKCHNCICQCFQDPTSTADVTQTFSLRPQISDYKNNMVVVGVKFTAKDDMIHLQIQQGKLLPTGKIDKASEEWLPLEDFVYVKNKTGGGFELKDGRSLQPGKDFAFITSKQQVVNLDDVALPSEYVITGVRLNNEEPLNPDTPVELQVRATKFDFASGELVKERNSTQWFSVRNIPNPPSDYLGERKEFWYSGPKNDPTKSPVNEPRSKPNQFIRFSPSDLQKTAGIYTVPLFDLRPVSATPSIPLGGVGMYVKHGEDYGGFLALKIFTVDFTGLIDPVLSEEQAENYEGLISAEEVDDDEEDEDDDDDEEDK